MDRAGGRSRWNFQIDRPALCLTRGVPEPALFVRRRVPASTGGHLCAGRSPDRPWLDNLGCRRSVDEGPGPINLNGILLTLMEMVNGR